MISTHTIHDSGYLTFRARLAATVIYRQSSMDCVQDLGSRVGYVSTQAHVGVIIKDAGVLVVHEKCFFTFSSSDAMEGSRRFFPSVI